MSPAAVQKQTLPPTALGKQSAVARARHSASCAG